MSRQSRTIFILAALLLVVAVPFLFSAWSRRGDDARDRLTLSQFLAAVNSEEIATAKWKGYQIDGQLTNGHTYKVAAPDMDSNAAAPVVDALRRSKSNWELHSSPLVAPMVPLLTVVAVPLTIMAVVLFLVYLFLMRPILQTFSGRTGT